MTGRRVPTWISLTDLTVPLLLIAAEAAWFTLLASSRARVHDHIAMDLPYLSIVIPAVVAVAGCMWTQSFRGRLWFPARLVAGVVGIALTAGVLSELTIPGSFLTVAAHPWSLTGHVDATVAWIAWWVSIYVWARGVWLGAGPVSTRHAGLSMAVSAVIFLAIFIGHASSGHGPFARATSHAGLLFFVWFLLGGAAFAFARQQDIESDAVPGARSRPTLVWGSALAAPAAALGLIGLLVALIGGPAAHLLAAGLRLLGDGLARVLALVFSWIPAFHLKARPPTQERAPGLLPGHKLAKVSPTSETAKIVAFVILAILALALIVALVLFIKRHWPKRRTHEQLDEADDEEDSVFSWAHFFAQLRAGLRRLLPHRRRRHAAGTAIAAAGAGGPGALNLPDPDSVREAYRRMLIEARVLGSPRRRAETTNELEGRLVRTVGDPAAVSLRRLTAVYDGVRYGGRDTDAVANRAARQDVEDVLPALRDGLAPPEPEEPQAPNEAAGSRRPEPSSRRRRWWGRRS